MTCRKKIEWVRRLRKNHIQVGAPLLDPCCMEAKVDVLVSLLTKVTGILSDSGLGMPVN